MRNFIFNNFKFTAGTIIKDIFVKVISRINNKNIILKYKIEELKNLKDYNVIDSYIGQSMTVFYVEEKERRKWIV